MKKNSLFKFVGIVLVIYALFTYAFPTATSFGVLENIERNQVDIFSFIRVIFEAFAGFSGIIIFILLVGAFYGVLKKTGYYENIVNLFRVKFAGKEMILLVAITVFLALISSLTGLEIGLFFIFPLLISIIVAIGFDKITALASTFGATVIGIYGTTFGSTMYSISNQMLGIEMNDGIYVKIALFIIGLTTLLFFNIRHAKKVFNSTTDEIKNYKYEDSLVLHKENIDTEEKPIATLVEEDKKKKKTVWPALIIIDVILLIILLGTTDFESIFGSNWFSTLHESIMEISILDFLVFEKLFGGITALGTWFTPTRLEYYSIILIVGIISIAIIYRVRPKYALESFIDGIREYLTPALLVGLACAVFVLQFHYPVFNTIGTWIMHGIESFSSIIAIPLTTIFNLLGSIFYVDIYYYSYYVISYIAKVCGDVDLYPLINIMFVSIYGLMLLVSPTSVLLLSSLSHSEVTYKDWIKYAFKIFGILLIISLFIFVFYMLVINYNLPSWLILVLVLTVIIIALVVWLIVKKIQHKKEDEISFKELKHENNEKVKDIKEDRNSKIDKNSSNKKKKKKR